MEWRNNGKWKMKIGMMEKWKMKIGKIETWKTGKNKFDHDALF